MTIVPRLPAVALLAALTTTVTAAQQSWTDHPAVARETPVRAVHLHEMRQRIDGLRRERGLPPAPYTSRPRQGDTIRGRDFTETISALRAVYREEGAELPAYGRVAPGEPIRAVTINALRAAIVAREGGPPRDPTSPRSYYTAISPSVIDPGYSPRAFFSASADLDGDGNEDLVIFGADYPWINRTSSYSPQPGRVYLGDGDGGFTRAPSELFPVDTLKTVHTAQVLFGDLNGDQRLDMFAAASGWDVLGSPGEQNRLFLSLPRGGWRDATDRLPRVSDRSHSATLGDIRGRGVIDIIVGNGYNPGPPYALLNDGDGSFVLDRSILPVGPGETMDIESGHFFPGTVLTDLNGDGLPELVVTAEATRPDIGNQNSTIFWNRSGTFSEQNKTVLPKPAPFVHSHIDLHAAGIDADGDGMRDLIVVGTQGDPFYRGWFVQLLMNRGGSTFIDETSSRFRPGEWFGGTVGGESDVPWAQRVRVLDFDGDGLPDVAVKFTGGPVPWPPGQPLVWLNDGRGRFTALEVEDFLSPGMEEWLFSSTRRFNDGMYPSTLLVKTRHGYSFISARSYPPGGGFVVTGLLAIRPYP